MKACKVSENPEKAVFEIQRYINSDEGRSDIETCLSSNQFDKNTAEEFSSLVSYFMTKYIIDGNYKDVENVLTTISNIYKGQQKANILVNLGWYKNIVGQRFEAIKDFNQSLGLLKINDDPVSLAITYNNKSVVELKNKQFKEAFRSAKTAITLVEPMIFEKIKHNSEASLREHKSFQSKLQVLLIAYKNFATVQRKLNNKKYSKTVFDHWIKMANKLLAPDSKFADLINISSSSETVRQPKVDKRENTPFNQITSVTPSKNNGHNSDEKTFK